MKNDNCFTNNFLALAKCDVPQFIEASLHMTFEGGGYWSVGKALA